MSQQPKNWQETELGNHVDLLTGHPFKSAQFTENLDDVRLLRGDNVAQGSLRWDGAKRWDIKEYNLYEKYQLNHGDVILAIDRPWITAGLKYAWICKDDTPSLLVQRVARMRGTNGLLTDYIRCLIGSPSFTDHVLSIITGVNVPHISAKDIKGFQFRLPPIAVQKRIVSVITTHDDLIENNTRRIEILEEMARRLYEEWFVRFRFPGCQGAAFKETDSGSIPNTWRHVPLGDMYRTSSGGTPSRKYPNYYGDDLRWVKTKELKDGPIFETEERISELGLKKSSAKMFPKHSVIIAMYGATIGQLGVLQEEAATNQACCALLPSIGPHGWAYAYLTLLYKRQNLIDLRAGAAQQNISQTIIKQFKVLKAEDDVHQHFENVATPLLSMSFRLHRINANLRAQRDLLLPKLISGQIDVSQAEEMAKEETAA